MSSRGAMVAGGSGADFEHREQVAQQYQLSVLNKSRLKCAIFFHMLLFLLLGVKLTAAILDRLDIFILELEELQIPQPALWEWVWALSPLGSLACLAALRRNAASRLRRALLALLLLGAAPLLACAVSHAADLCTLLAGVGEDEPPEVPMWQEMPICAIWLVWVCVCAQVHGFQFLFAARLLTAWRQRGQLKQQ